MKTILAMAAVSTFALGCQAAGAQEQKARLAACLDAGFADLMSAGSRDFTSPQYFLICDEAKTVEGTPGCKREEKRKSFTFEAPAGFRIDGARFSVVMKTPETSASVSRPRRWSPTPRSPRRWR